VPMTALNNVSIELMVQNGITYEATGPPLKAPCQLAGKTYSSPYL
jgi:hypothetical protein